MSDSDPMATFKGLSRNDQLFLGVGVVALIFSFIAFAHVSYQGHSGLTQGAWSGIGILGGLLLVAALAAGAAMAFAPKALESLPVSGRVAATGLAALAFVFFVLRWLTLPNYFGIGYSLDWGGYVLLILNIVMVVVGFMALKASGDALPWEKGGGTSAPPAPPADPPAA